jgi:hypothetical protein
MKIELQVTVNSKKASGKERFKNRERKKSEMVLSGEDLFFSSDIIVLMKKKNQLRLRTRTRRL